MRCVLQQNYNTANNLEKAAANLSSKQRKILSCSQTDNKEHEHKDIAKIQTNSYVLSVSCSI